MVKNPNTSTPLLVVVIVGAVAEAQSTEFGHVIERAVESCITFSIKAEARPLDAGLEKV